VTRRAVHRRRLRKAIIVVLVGVWFAAAGAVGAPHNVTTRTGVVREAGVTRLIIRVTIVVNVI
jgi:hypothetical protein